MKGNILMYVVVLSLLVFSSNVFSQENDEQTPAKLLVSNIFSETDLRQALKDISTQVGINIIADNTVRGLVSAEFSKVPLEKCLEIILSAGGYVFKKIDDYYLVGLPVPTNPSFRNLCCVEYVKLKYIDPRTVPLANIYSKYVQADKDRNLLVITAPSRIISEIKENIKQVDIPPKQVVIEAIVTEISSRAMKALGVDWKWNWTEGTGVGNASGEISLNNLIGKINYNSNNRNVIATLKMLIEKGEAKIRANPRVIAIDNESASIYIGKEKYYSISGENNNTYAKLEMISSGITLKIQPKINEDEVIVNIEPEVSDVQGGETALKELPLINKRRVKTTVRIKDGETVVIGGLLQQHERKVESSWPILGKIPVLNLLFKSNESVMNENEVVILITPHILKEEKICELPKDIIPKGEVVTN